MAKKLTEDAAKAAASEWLEADVALQSTQADKRQKVTPLVQEYEAKEKTLIDRKARAAEVLEQYAAQNRETLLPGEAKSTGFYGATIGYKKSPASLKLAQGHELPEVLEALDTNELTEYIITKHELDKAGILRNAATLSDLLPTLGLEIVQEEKFYVKA